VSPEGGAASAGVGSPQPDAPQRAVAADAARFARLTAAFEQAYELPESAREPMLAALAREDVGLAAEVRTLLASAADQAADVAESDDEPLERLVDRRVGRYVLRRFIGRGGMGAVYEAESEHPSRTVALKLLDHPALASQSHRTQLLRRFELEANLLGRLQHPAIAQIFDAGRADLGDGPRPYLVMELVRGRPVTRYADEERLGLRERLRLVAEIADAVQHAHTKLVIHRDLKPANILVTDAGQPKVLDFGVARATDADLQLTTAGTGVGQIIGTLPYMSPEQVSGVEGAVDARADVYALGVIAYELLSGRLPLDLRSRALPHRLAEAARLVEEVEPPRLGALRRALRGDVETIVAKALMKEKERRYASAEALGADIRRYLDNEPIAARPAGTMYQLVKFARRNRGLVGGVTASVLILVVGAALTTGAWLQALAAWEVASGEAARANASASLAREMTNIYGGMFGYGGEVAIDIAAVSAGVRERLSALARRAFERQAGGAGSDGAAVQALDLVAVIDSLDYASVASEMLDVHVLTPVIAAAEEKLADRPEELAELLDVLGTARMGLGRHAQALELYRYALDRIAGRASDDDQRVIQITHNIGAALVALERWQEARAPVEKAVAAGRRVLGEDDQQTLRSRHNLGVILAREGPLDEGESTFRDVLARQSQALGADHPDTALTLTSLGTLLYERRRWADAEACLRDAADRLARTRGADHVETLRALNNLGFVISELGRGDEALAILTDVAERRRRILGDLHPDTLTTQTNVAVQIQEAGRYDEAIAAYREILAGFRASLGDKHRKTLIALGNLGTGLAAAGRFAEAEPCMAEACQRAARVLGTRDANVLLMKKNLGDCWNGLGRYAEAAEILQGVLDIESVKPGGPKLDLAEVEISLGKALLGLGDYAGAERVLLAAYERRREDDLGSRGTGPMAEALAVTYERWNAAEPEKGYAARAAEWRERLEQVRGGTRAASAPVR